MCIIASVPAGMNIEQKKLDTMWKHNSDGGGIAWIEDGKVKTFKSMKLKPFKKKFKEMLDNPIEYDTENVAKHMVWEERISKWFNNWENVFDLKPMGDTEGLQKCVDFIKKKGVTTKHEMITEFGWGYRVKFNNYRNALREMDEIKFTKDGYEWVGDYEK